MSVTSPTYEIVVDPIDGEAYVTFRAGGTFTASDLEIVLDEMYDEMYDYGENHLAEAIPLEDAQTWVTPASGPVYEITLESSSPTIIWDEDDDDLDEDSWIEDL